MIPLKTPSSWRTELHVLHRLSFNMMWALFHSWHGNKFQLPFWLAYVQGSGEHSHHDLNLQNILNYPGMPDLNKEKPLEPTEGPLVQGLTLLMGSAPPHQPYGCVSWLVQFGFYEFSLSHYIRILLPLFPNNEEASQCYMAQASFELLICIFVL